MCNFDTSSKMSKMCAWGKPLFWNSMTQILAITLPRTLSLMSFKRASSFKLKTWVINLRQSLAICPERSAYVISFHLRLQVNMTKRSDFTKFANPGHGILVQLAHGALTTLEWRQDNHLLLDVIPKNVTNIQCILKTIVQVATKPLLVLANKLQVIKCICVNNELLQKPSGLQNPFLVNAMLQHVRVKLKHGDARGTAFTTYGILVILDEPKAIPFNGMPSCHLLHSFGKKRT